MGYDLDDAVFALVGQSSPLAVRIEKKQDIVVPVEFPKPLEGRWKRYMLICKLVGYQWIL